MVVKVELDVVKDSYVNWIRENTHLSDGLNNSIEISSPFIDSLNENIKLYVVPESNDIKVTDDGYTIWNLETTGMVFRKGSQRERILLDIMERYSVDIDLSTKELYIKTDNDNLGMAIHVLTQTILSVSDLLRFNKKNIKNLFYEEVNNYFTQNKEIFDYFPDFEIQGKSKLMHRFDYLMTTQNKQKKLVKLVNSLDQVQLERILLSWQDTSQQRIKKYNENLGMVALINDSQKKISSKFEIAFAQYGIEPIGFSNKAAVNQSLSLVG